MKTFKRWVIRLTLAFLAFVLLVVVVVFAGRQYMNGVGNRELAETTARIDAAEPGWRLEALEPARQKAAPPDDQNSGPRVIQVADLVTAEKNQAWRTWLASDVWGSRRLSPNLPGKALEDGIRGQKESTAEARTLARDLRRFPTGYYPLTVGQNPYTTLLPHTQKPREVVALLEYDAVLAALEGDPERGLVAAHAALNAARSVGDEPFLISQLVRLACAQVSLQASCQVLAWGEPKANLAELQAAYRAEADVPFLLNGLLGERASLHRTFEGLESGKLTYDDFVNLGLQQGGPGEHAAFRLYKGLLPGDHAKALDILTQYIAISKRPHHEQAAAFAAIPMPPGPPDDFRYIVSRLLLPACNKVAQASNRLRAMLLSGSVAIACERFRQKVGRWPDGLAEIPPDLLPDRPPDPFDGKELRFRQLPDGIAVYSVGDPETARRQAETKDPLAGLGIGWRLWDADKRRQPPPPEPKLDGPPEEPKQP